MECRESGIKMIRVYLTCAYDPSTDEKYFFLVPRVVLFLATTSILPAGTPP
jgi:hypothetical protein